jgi:hypothetical protein
VLVTFSMERLGALVGGVGVTSDVAARNFIVAIRVKKDSNAPFREDQDFITIFHEKFPGATSCDHVL